jgi:hypothetical protein
VVEAVSWRGRAPEVEDPRRRAEGGGGDVKGQVRQSWDSTTAVPALRSQRLVDILVRRRWMLLENNPGYIVERWKCALQYS